MNTGIIFLTAAGRHQVAKTTGTNENPRSGGNELHRCPHCQGVIYSRRFTICRECGNTLGEGTQLEARQVSLLATEQRNSKERKQAMAAIQLMGSLRL